MRSKTPRPAPTQLRVESFRNVPRKRQTDCLCGYQHDDAERLGDGPNAEGVRSSAKRDIDRSVRRLRSTEERKEKWNYR